MKVTGIIFGAKRTTIYAVMQASLVVWLEEHKGKEQKMSREKQK